MKLNNVSLAKKLGQVLKKMSDCCSGENKMKKFGNKIVKITNVDATTTVRLS